VTAAKAATYWQVSRCCGSSRACSGRWNRIRYEFRAHSTARDQFLGDDAIGPSRCPSPSAHDRRRGRGTCDQHHFGDHAERRDALVDPLDGDRIGLSQTAVSRIWRALGLQPHRPDTWKLSKDPQFIDKVRDVVGLYLDSLERAVASCVDEKSLRRPESDHRHGHRQPARPHRADRTQEASADSGP
jgi:hypothetical protein